jgi:hypothetical protein
MKANWFIILLIIICEWITGCHTVPHQNEIAQVTYISDAGPILPELQWHEEVIITKAGVTLIRNGRTPDTEINEGTWEFAVAEQKVQALFAQLETVDCTKIKRIEPDSPVDGGDTASYTIVYGRDQSYSLVYAPGITYTDGELVVKPVDTFLQNLNLPDEVASRYK